MTARLSHLSLLPVAALLLASCASCGLDSKMALIKHGMSIDQVEALLGQPTRIETKTTGQAMSDEVYHYSTPSGEGQVVFINGIVFSTALPFGANS